MKIKTFSMMVFFLSGIAVHFAGAMKPKQMLVCPGRVTSINPLNGAVNSGGNLYCTGVIFSCNYQQGKEYKKTWSFQDNTITNMESDDTALAQLKEQVSTAHLTQIIEPTVMDKYILTVAHDEKNGESYIKNVLVSQPIVIKTSDGKQKEILVNGSNLRACCKSKTLLNRLVDEQQHNQEISLGLTKDQLDIAWSCMLYQVVIPIHSYSVKNLCDLIVADSVLKIKTDNEDNVLRDRLSAIKTKFGVYDGVYRDKAIYFDGIKCLPEVHRRGIALHIAKDFITKTKYGAKYSVKNLDFQLSNSESRTDITRGGLSIVGVQNSVNISVTKNNSSQSHTLNHSSEVKEIAISKGVDNLKFPAHIVTLAGGKVTVWSLVDGDKPSYTSTILNPDNNETIVSIDITQDGKFVAIAPQFKPLQIWDIETRSCVVEIAYSFNYCDRIWFFQNHEECSIRIMSGHINGKDKKINLEGFFQRVEFVKSVDVCTADFVNRLAENSVGGAITLTKAEHEELSMSQHKAGIEKFFTIKPADAVTVNKKSDQKIEKTTVVPKDDNQQISSKLGPMKKLLIFRRIMAGVVLSVGLLCLYLIYCNMNH